MNKPRNPLNHTQYNLSVDISHVSIAARGTAIKARLLVKLTTAVEKRNGLISQRLWEASVDRLLKKKALAGLSNLINEMY